MKFLSFLFIDFGISYPPLLKNHVRWTNSTFKAHHFLWNVDLLEPHIPQYLILEQWPPPWAWTNIIYVRHHGKTRQNWAKCHSEKHAKTKTKTKQMGWYIFCNFAITAVDFFQLWYVSYGININFTSNVKQLVTVEVIQFNLISLSCRHSH